MNNVLKADFNGNLYSFNLDGWFNATEAAKRFGKAPNEWMRLPDTIKYIAALERKYGKIPYLKTKRGAHGGGTWLNPKLAVRFAQWLDIDFAIWCDEQIDSIIRNGIRAEGNANLIPLLLNETCSEWELRFTDDYYRALAKTTNTRYSGHSGGTPALYGQITDKWVYGTLLPEDVYLELKQRKNKSEKMHQWITKGGQQLLDKRIELVTSIARTSTDFKDFESRMMVETQKKGQFGLIFPKAA